MQKLPWDFQVAVVAVIASAGGLLWLLAPSMNWHLWPELLMFAVLIEFASMFPIPNPRGGYITSATTLLYVLLSVHDPGSALLVTSVAHALGAAISRGWTPWRTLFNGAQMGISVALAAIAFRIAEGSPSSPGFFSFLVPFIFAALVFQVANNFFVSLLFSRLRRASLFATWLSEVRELFWSNLLTIPTASLLVLLYVSVHPAMLLLYLISLPAQRWAIQLYLQQREIYSQAIESLVLAIDANFPRGKGHSTRVADLAVAVARQMDLSDSVVDGIELGALIHDVGMIGLEEADQVVPGHSQPDRFREHVTVGAEIARDLPRRDVSPIVRYHHENFDGTGYLGLKAHEIPVGARIVAVVEAFDSMLSGGFPYSERRSPAEAVQLIQEQSGTVFDPQVVTAFRAVLESQVGVALVGELPGSRAMPERRLAP